MERQETLEQIQRMDSGLEDLERFLRWQLVLSQQSALRVWNQELLGIEVKAWVVFRAFSLFLSGNKGFSAICLSFHFQ